MRIIRVFPRRTNATPTDELAYIGEPDLFAEADRVMVSVTFDADIPEGVRLEKLWRYVAPTEIGGPAFGDPGGEFMPGQFLKPGYVITSRGCPNRCWFCKAWRREGGIRELPIRDGWNVLDNSLLACSEPHIKSVFEMLDRQPQRPRFTGGLDAALMKPWIARRLRELKTAGMFFAYDTPHDRDTVATAAEMMWEAGFSKRDRNVRCYVLIGYSGDTFADAERRLRETISWGLFPMAMLYRAGQEAPQKEWRRFAREWARPYLIALKTYGQEKAACR